MQEIQKRQNNIENDTERIKILDTINEEEKENSSDEIL